MVPKSKPRAATEVVPSSTPGANLPLTPILEDATVGISNADTLGHILYDIMGWGLDDPDLGTFFSTLLSQAEIHEFNDLLEFAEYSYDDYHEMYGIPFCLEYVDHIINMKVLSTLYRELHAQGDHSPDPTHIRCSTFNHRWHQARTQATKEFVKVLKVPDALFTTLHESGTPVKKHLNSMAFLGQPDDVGSLSDETYITVWESPPEGDREPHVIHHNDKNEEPPTRGTPIHPEMASQPGRVSTVQESISPAVEPQTGGTLTSIHDSPQQGGLFAIPKMCSMLFQVHMLRVMTEKCAMSRMTWSIKVRYCFTPYSNSQALILEHEGVQ